MIGEPYEDADGVGYLPMFRQPVMVFEATKEVLVAAHGRALTRALPRSVFTSDLFTTGNDRDNRAAVRAVATAELDVVGLAVYGPRNGVDKVVKGRGCTRRPPPVPARAAPTPGSHSPLVPAQAALTSGFAAAGASTAVGTAAGTRRISAP